MSYSAKSLLQKAKSIENEKKERLAAELKIKNENRKEEIENLKKNKDFIKVIGLKCVEAALNEKFNTTISKDEAVKYVDKILDCGLTVNPTKLNAKELKINYPEIYDQLEIEDKLLELEFEIDEIDSIDTSHKPADVNLEKINDLIFKYYDSATDYEWHVDTFQKEFLDDIRSLGLCLSIDYLKDADLVNQLTELLSILNLYVDAFGCYSALELRDEESALFYIHKMFLKIPDIKRALKEHEKKFQELINLSTNKEREKELKINNLKKNINDLVTYKHTIYVLDWQYSDNESKENYFLNPENLRWIMNNSLMKELFKFVEKKILDSFNSCEIIFKNYGPRRTHNQLLHDGLYFDDFLIEISIEDMQNIFECLGYKTKLISNAPTANDPSNLVNNYLLKLSWVLK